MSIAHIQTFLSRGRLTSLATGIPLPDLDTGACLLADISGFTPLTESLQNSLGAQQGAEALTEVVNCVFAALIAQVHHYGGDVLGLAGDAITCWFPESDPSSPPHFMEKRSGPGESREACSRALTTALAIQQEMTHFQAVPTPGGQTHALTIKAGLAYGPIRCFTTGQPEYGRFDMRTGETLTRMVAAEHHATQGEIVAAPEFRPLVGVTATWGAPRDGFLPLCTLERLVEKREAPEPPALPLETLRPYFPPILLEWLVSAGEYFLGELRPVVSAFVRFEGLDYEGDPRVGEKLDHYIAAVQGTAAHYGGNLIRLEYGDKGSVIHVVFGAPRAHEDDAARAVGWALDLQNAIREMPFLRAQYVGMTCGQVYAGALGAATRRGYTLMGDEVNVSARLMQACQPGQVLVTERIMRAAQKCYLFHQFPGFQVKGKYGPIPVATPVAPLPAIQQQMPAGPLIGREQEMAQMEQLLDDLLAGHGRVLRLSGPEGVGKSRLVAEVLQRALQRGVRTLVGSGQSVGQGTPYLPWQEMLRTLFGLQRAWPAQMQASQIQTMLQWINPEWLPRVPLLGDVLGLEIADTPMTAAFDAHLRQESLFALLGDLFARLAAQQPLLLLLDDGHWFDQASCALVVTLARRLVGERILVIVTLRPPLAPDHPLRAGLDDLSHLVSLELAELDPAATGTLVRAQLGGDLPADLMDLVQERTQGNPLFVEELAAALRESGRLQQVAGRWTLVGVGSQAVALPDSIRSVALARIDALDEGSKFTLKVASVAGRTFAPRVVHEVHPNRPSAVVLDQHLQTLEQRDLIREEEPRQSYRFKHSVTREVAYEILLYAQRQALHRAIAAWYEQHQAATLSAHYPLLAYHYHGAGDDGRECHYARLAGEQAAARYANADALRYLDRALELTPKHDVTANYDLLMVREKVHDLQGDRQNQLRDLETLQSLSDAVGEEPRWIEVALRRGRYAEATGDYAGAIAAAQAVISLAQSVGDVPSEAAGRLQWGRALWQQGDVAGARQQLERSLAQARSAKLCSMEAAARLNMGIVALYQGDYGSARNDLEKARGLYQTLGDPVGENKALNSLGNILLYEGHVAAAQLCYEQALQVCRKIGWRRGEVVMLGNLGAAHEGQINYTEATGTYQQALRISREIGDAWSEARTLNNLGLVLLFQGDYAQAWEHLEQALGTYRSLIDLRDEALVLSSMSLLAHLQGDHSAAQDYGQMALQLARQLEDCATEGEALTHLGHAQFGLGDAAAAAESYCRAATIRREIGEDNLAMESLAGLARAALAQGDRDHAYSLVQEILAHMETRSLDGTYEPLRIHLTCYQVLRESGDPHAGAILDRAYRLLQERAGHIADETMRRSFLENVAVHYEIAAEFDQHRPEELPPARYLAR